jgi:hypothetical protein
MALSLSTDKWNTILTVIYDMISSYMETRERLIIIERICSSFHKHSINGFGWQHSLDLSFPFIKSNDQLDNAIISLGITKRLRYHNRIRYLRAYNMTTKVALSMGSWTNLHTFEWFTDHYDSEDGGITKSLIGSLFELMALLQTLLITPIINSQRHLKLSLPSYLPLLQRLEVLLPLSTSLEPVYLDTADELFRLRVCHLPKLSHLLLFHGCDFEIDDDVDKWHSPLIQSLQFGAIIYREDLKTIISSSLLPLLYTLHVYCADATELEMVACQCPNLQHLSIHDLDIDSDDFGSSSSWLQLKSLIHLQRLTIKGCDIKSLESFPQLVELVQYLSNSHNHQSMTSSSDDMNVSIVSNGSLALMNDMPCHEWLSNNHEIWNQHA